ncbi:MAG: response regulator [Thermodesulfovibrio sp.]|nr:response regulator [Thermodesulfovibrio sp.]
MKKKVLIIEDNELVRETLKEMLEFLGFEVTLAEDGNTAIEKFILAETKKEPFDLVFIDLILPGMHGFEVMKELKKIKSDITAVISSGYSNDNAFRDYENLGFKDILKKPYTLQELIRLLQSLKLI